jgi:hypothetical protein
MKLLLTSAGIKNTSINDALVELLGKPIAESTALCIRTATYAMGGTGSTWRFITGRATTPMTDELPYGLMASIYTADAGTGLDTPTRSGRRG